MGVNTGWLLPAGVLRIIEMVLGFFTMVFYFFLYGWVSYINMVFAFLCLIATIFLFIVFLFSFTDKMGGDSVWKLVDMICNIVFVVLYFLIVVLGTAFNSWWCALCIVAWIFAVLTFIAYIISLIFSIFEFMGKPLV